MKRKIDIEDLNRQITIRTFQIDTPIIDKMKELMDMRYYTISEMDLDNELMADVFLDNIDLLLCDDGIQISADRVDKYIQYVNLYDLEYYIEKICLMVRRVSYENYFEKLKLRVNRLVANKTDDMKVRILLNLFDLKDNYTKNHAIRVATYAVKIGQKLKLNEEQITDLKYSALLHDVGKLVLPTRIITKPGDLTSEERTMMEYHARLGSELLRDIFSKKIRYAILCHHEQLDGRGYPKHLKNDEIPLFAKIIFICESFDTMVSSILYGKAKTFEEAIEYMKKYAKKPSSSRSRVPYDYRIVKIFLQIFENEGKIFDDPIEKMNYLLNS